MRKRSSSKSDWPMKAYFPASFQMSPSRITTKEKILRELSQGQQGKPDMFL